MGVCSLRGERSMPTITKDRFAIHKVYTCGIFYIPFFNHSYPTPMASTSSSSIIASASAKYDIFLSFSGQDTRHSFTDHLYAALNRAGISAFRDNDDINRGEELKPEIEKAIIASKGSIVVLSKNYATSTWCLDELWLILERRREFDHFVLPLFYHVDPSHVRKQDDTFKIEVKASSKWTHDNVKRWREALTKVAELSGLVLSGPETEFLKKIIDYIYNKVASKKADLPCNLIGMNARDKDINSWLEQSNAKVLAICGMGGSGKTTLAKYIVSSKCRQFEVISIVEDISGTCQEQNLFDELFQKFAKDIVGDQKMPMPMFLHDHTEGVLRKKKALIIFDDINKPRQLDHFLKIENIHEESKIIITTRKTNTHNWFKPRTWRYHEHKMQLLDFDESLELLSLHAFGFKFPKEGYEELTKEALHYCGGNPLALEVLGSSLSEDVSIPFWRNTLDLVKRDMNFFDIQHVLIRSFDSLPNKNSKELFLHIACFFVGEDKNYVEQILEHDYCASSGIQVLINRCLLSVSPNNKLMMHQLIQEMGKNIIHEESKLPTERSRVLSRDSYKILRNGDGSKTMEGLALEMKLLEESFFQVQQNFEASDFKTDSLTKMDNLKLLKLNDVDLAGSYEDFSEDLRWLHWRRCNLITIPSGLFQRNLVTLEMQDSMLEVFEPPIVLPFLKTLDLGGSTFLSEIRSISRLPNLETLILCHCPELVLAFESIGGLTNLSLLNMIGCDKFLQNIGSANKRQRASTSGGGGLQQTSFTLPYSLVWLSLRDCSLNITEYFTLSFDVQRKLQYLDLGGGRFESLPSYNHLENLRVLDLSHCSQLKELLCLPRALVELYVYCCTFLERITFESHQFTLQDFGYEGCSKLFEIEGFFKLVEIAKLDETDLGHMVWLKEYQYHKVRLIGDTLFTRDMWFTLIRSSHIQMLYEFGIMSTSLPDVQDPNMIYEYFSESPSVCFSLPSCPENRRLIGLNVSFKYTISGEDDPTWFAKIRTRYGVDYMYNPHAFGHPGDGKVGIWLSFWPIGSKLVIGEEVNVSIVVMSEIMEAKECGASLVYVDDDETLENNMQWDLSAFQLTTGAFHLCRRDYFKLMEVGKLTPSWFSILVGDTIDNTEVQGWRKTGRPCLSDSSLTGLSSPSRAKSSKEASSCDDYFLVTSIIHDMNLSYSIRHSDLTSMASTSSSSIIASPPANYDIFLSFRGEDTRHSFTDHLYAALNRAGISTFRDNDEINRGEELKPEIEKAIRASKGSIVVLSKNYATSAWCLDELWLILERRREFDHFVLPVFYHVDPSHVRKQDDTFKIEVKASSKWTDYNVKRWREALTKVAELSGLVLSGSETEFLKKIIDNIYNKVACKKVDLPRNLTGINAHDKYISSWLEQSGDKVFAICGMGGSGKTTLAKYIVSSKCQQFEIISVVENISSTFKKQNDLNEVFQNFAKDILGERMPERQYPRDYTDRVLRKKKALIVFDDVNEPKHLESFIRIEDIYEESKIIITTRKNDTHNWFNPRTWGCQKCMTDAVKGGIPESDLAKVYFASIADKYKAGHFKKDCDGFKEWLNKKEVEFDIGDADDPVSFKEAMESPNRDKWMKAMEDELAIRENVRDKEIEVLKIGTKEQLADPFTKALPVESYKVYKMELLDMDVSLELLSLHAFGLKIPKEGYMELAKEVLQYCDGNPLALEVLGSSLSVEISITFWRSTLDSLKRDMDSGIQLVLKRSYDALPNQYNKDLFLHIACFFVGEDKDYVEKILEPDYCASSGIKVLINRCLLYVLPNNKLMMHQLIEEMGKSIINAESKLPEGLSRSWRSIDSYKILNKGEGSKTMEGLSLDMPSLRNDQQLLTFVDLRTDSLRKMDSLKLLKLNDVHLTGSCEDFSEDLRWLCWHQFSLTDIPFGLFQRNLVAIDMRNSKLEVFEPPIVLPFLKTLDLRGSASLSKIHNISQLPTLETLILCDCDELVHVCESIRGLIKLALLNMIGCNKFWQNIDSTNIRLNASTSGGGGLKQTSFSLPCSLVWLSLRNCHCYISNSEFFPLSFSIQLKLQYLDLGGGWFDSLPSYNHLENLRVLDLSWCRRLKHLLCLPSALVELYIYYCTSLEKITFESHRFTLQDFGYEGCVKLNEVEGFIKLVPIAKLDHIDLGHMVWLKEYHYHEICLVGDDELTSGRGWHIQMLYEFGIMSISLPDIKDPNTIYEYLSESPSLCFRVPSCPENKRLIGLNVSFKYTVSDNDDPAWFVKIRTNNGVDYIYNPHVFGHPGEGEVGIWLSFWPIGSKLVTGDEVNVSIVVMSEIMEVQECGAGLVYVDNTETLENKTQWDLSAFQLTSGAFYLCRRDFFKLMEVGRLTPGWLGILVGETIDDTEVRGWRKSGRPCLPDSSLSELPEYSSLIELSLPSHTNPPLPSRTNSKKGASSVIRFQIQIS
ncbi:hypothetical protein OSB04_016063 [Centaurea solstitialis]|uniref:TIR domain-containing protein n=1 Tax=Centaurea solstitialis TaxID=347529 RepID=A0AA38T7Z3_9ASTR|nr:hypothetical protein OSB04_016063 [Centaurea solstitialis]